MSLVGITPPELTGIDDDPNLLNLTYTFRGRLAIDYDLTPNVLFIEVPGVAETSLRPFFGLTNFVGNPLYTVSQVPIPTIVPEPGAMILAGSLLAVLRRRSHRDMRDA
jgi:hypothetical protein